MTYTGGLKTDAGRNRLVPLHPLVADLVRKNYEQAVGMGSKYLFNDPDGQQGTYLTYDKYRGRFKKVCPGNGRPTTPDTLLLRKPKKQI